MGCALQLQTTTLKPKLCAYNQDIIMAVSYDTKTKKNRPYSNQDKSDNAEEVSSDTQHTSLLDSAS